MKSLFFIFVLSLALHVPYVQAQSTEPSSPSATADERVQTTPEDDLPPIVLPNVSLSTKEVIAGDQGKITIQFRAEDSGSGVKPNGNGEVLVLYPSGEIQNYYTRRSEQDPELLASEAGFDEFAADGEYQVLEIRNVQDNKGNTSLPLDLRQYNIKFKVKTPDGQTEDKIAPELVPSSVRIVKTFLKRGETIEIDYQIKDNDKGFYTFKNAIRGFFVAEVRVKPEGPYVPDLPYIQGKSNAAPSPDDSKITVKEDSVTARLEIPKDILPGLYSLTQFDGLTDVAHNSIKTVDLKDLNLTFEIIAGDEEKKDQESAKVETKKSDSSSNEASAQEDTIARLLAQDTEVLKTLSKEDQARLLELIKQRRAALEKMYKENPQQCSSQLEYLLKSFNEFLSTKETVLSFILRGYEKASTPAQIAALKNHTGRDLYQLDMELLMYKYMILERAATWTIPAEYVIDPRTGNRFEVQMSAANVNIQKFILDNKNHFEKLGFAVSDFQKLLHQNTDVVAGKVTLDQATVDENTRKILGPVSGLSLIGYRWAVENEGDLAYWRQANLNSAFKTK